MAGGPLNQDLINSMPNFAVPGLATPRNIAVGQPSPAPAPAPQVGNLIDQMRLAGQLPQMAGYGAQPTAPAPVRPVVTAPAPKQSAQDFVNSLPTYNPTPSTAAAAPNPRVWNVPPLPPGLPGGASVAPSISDTAGQGTWANGTNTASGAGGSGSTVAGKFIDPAAAIQAGFDQQVAYRQQAIQDIMAAARQGNPGNYSFRLAHLIGAIGGNNFAGIQGQGVDALNQSIAGVSSAGIGAGAAMYGADQATARTGMELGERAAEFAQTPREVENAVTYNQFGLPAGSRTSFALPGGMVDGRAQSPSPATPVPTRQQFLQRARSANPGASDADLTKYYNQKYGG
ncbi:hypothetical protein [Burkholderia sp. BE12]|uniref:hypothetical protein n=1 Tax=Burkholderia sp. BE12 TaxID=2082394 RepID=UPI00131A2319|nr:hypothetical protein [Burkholderia sp. BE12]